VTRVVLLLALVAVLADGCGEEEAPEGGAAESVPVSPRAITEADSGESFTLPAGSELRLRLSGDYEWSEPTVHGGAVELVRVDYFRDPGFSEWVVHAARSGTAKIAARGTPACAGQAGCPDEPLRFQVAITVAP
jgi:hypothetical protein